MPNYKRLTPFKRCVLQNFPFIEADFDALTNYGLLCKIVEYLNNVISSQNEVQANVEALNNAFIELKNYVDNYFENLDVEDEINNKLDEMYESGQLNTILANYVDPQIESIESEVANMQAQISAITNYPPVFVSSVESMTDHTKVYVLTTDSKWYYYDGTAFVEGGNYLTNGSLNDIDYYISTTNSNDSANLLNPYTASDNTSLNGTTGATQSSNDYWITDYIPVDNTKYETLSSGGRQYGQVTYPYENKGAYKHLFYASDKSYLFQNTTQGRAIGCPSGQVEEYGDTIAYVRVQFKKSETDYYLRNDIQIQLSGANLTFKDLYSSHKSVSHYNIGKGEVHNTKMNEGARQAVMASAFEKSINPFDISDFSNVTIQSSTGAMIGGANSRARLSTNNLIYVPAGTEVSVAEGWQMLALEYSKDDTYLGRYASEWDSSIYFAESAFVRFTFKTEPEVELLSLSSVENLIQSITVSHRTGGTPDYFYSGEKITLNNTFTATSTGLKTKHQDGAIYGNTIIEVGSDGTYFVQDIDGNILQASNNLDQYSTIAPHANSVCFGSEKYQSSDNFPVFYANAYNNTALPKGTCYVYRLKNDYLTTLLQTIRIGFTEDTIWTGGGVNIRPYGNFVVDTDNNKLYVFTLIDSLNVTRFFKFDLPTLSEGANVTLNTDDIEEYFDVPYMPYIQGCCYFKGKIYAMAGNNSTVANSSKLNVVDLTKKETVSEVYLGNQFSEPETCFVKDDTLYMGQTRLYAYQF